MSVVCNCACVCVCVRVRVRVCVCVRQVARFCEFLLSLLTGLKDAVIVSVRFWLYHLSFLAGLKDWVRSHLIDPPSAVISILW